MVYSATRATPRISSPIRRWQPPASQANPNLGRPTANRCAKDLKHLLAG